jgi:DNA ligase (NAD+)
MVGCLYRVCLFSLVVLLFRGPAFAGTCPEISDTEAQRRITDLAAEVRRHNLLYYEEHRPVISDAGYDRLFAELVLLEKCFPAFASADSPTRRVGSADGEGRLPTVEHERPMLSLSSSVGPEVVESLLQKTSMEGAVYFIVQPKVDGLPVELTYEAGKLVSAATRGDGRHGQNVTATARRIEGVPPVLSGKFPPRVVVRGEVYADRAISGTVGLAGGTLAERYATLRHLAAGTLQSQNPDPPALAALRVFCFELVIPESTPGVTSDTKALQLLAEWGFRIRSQQTRRVKTLDEVKSVYGEYLVNRDRQPFAMDGIVVKVDDLSLRRRLGEGARAPFWAAAWKFPPATARTSVRKIVWTTGRTGRRTPVAEVAPVRLGGTSIRRVSLHNAAEVVRLGIAAGDEVVIGLVGDVVPQVLAVPQHQVPARELDAAAAIQAVQPIDACLEDAPGCRDRFVSRLAYFVSKEGLNIAGLGHRRLRMLVEAGAVRDLPSLFRLKKESLAAVSGFGEKRSQSIAAAIVAAARPEPFRLVAALGIPGVGKVASRRLAKEFVSLDALLSLEEEDMRPSGRDADGARRVRIFFSSPAGRNLLEQFREMGMLTKRASLSLPGQDPRSKMSPPSE